MFSTPGSTVRPEYLLYGGTRTEEELAAQRALEKEAEPEIYARLHEAIPALRHYSPAVWVSVLMCVNRATEALERIGAPVAEEDFETLAETVWELANAPLKRWLQHAALGTGRQVRVGPGHADGWRLNDYTMAALNAVSLGIPAAMPESLTTEDAESWPHLLGEGNVIAEEED